MEGAGFLGRGAKVAAAAQRRTGGPRNRISGGGGLEVAAAGGGAGVQDERATISWQLLNKISFHDDLRV